MGKRGVVTGIIIVLGVLATVTAWAENVDPAAVDNLLKTMQGVQSAEPLRLLQTPEGYVRFLGAPPNNQFNLLAPSAKALTRPADNAKAFIAEHREAFGVKADKVTLTPVTVSEDSGRTYIKLQQKYGAVPVFGAQMMVQLNTSGGVTSVLSDVMRNTERLDNGTVSTTPTVTSERAEQLAIAYISTTQQQSLVGADKVEATKPELMILDPAVLGQSGAPALAWRTEVSGTGKEPVQQAVFVNAQSGAILLAYSLVDSALFRIVKDANFSPLGTTARTEGQSPTGIPDVDNAYDYLGDTYNFYATEHERDSYDEQGSPLRATVRLSFGEDMPFENAMWVSGLDAMYFGPGWLTDDVVAHEYTHGVTDYASQLIYFGASGAINESFSDMWGEFVDLTNGRGNDTPAVRWLVGEDLAIGAIRSMKDPPLFGQPDRLTAYVNTPFDNEGVHTNSGIGNKLCYLLTDGDFFNGYSVQGMGIDTTAKLFYELQRNLLTPASDYTDLYAALYQAALNIGLTFDERLNVQAASLAVEIAQPSSDSSVRDFRAVPSMGPDRRPIVLLTWSNPESGTLQQVIIVRKEGSFPTGPTDGDEIYRGTGHRFVDGLDPTDPLTESEYFYALYADLSGQLPQFAFARANTATGAAPYLTEVFSGSHAFDLGYTQVLYSPVGSPPGGSATSQPPGYGDYTNYVATITHNAYSLPVAKEDYYTMPISDDGYAWLDFGDAGFPLFGTRYSLFLMAANGYITPLTTGLTYADNFPSLASHYNVPRISFLFADLNPSAFGLIWARDMSDRKVVTFEGIPEFSATSSPAPNTVQVELFYSGHIRVTYLDIAVRNAVVGLSDGNGVPPNPADYVAGAQPVNATTNFSALPEGLPDRVTFWPPLGRQTVEPDEWVQFTATANSPNGVPRLTAAWNGPGAVPFADGGDGTGLFRWQPTISNSGQTYNVVITATQGGQSAYEVVSVTVLEQGFRPEARDLLLKTTTADEDPSMSREIPPHTALQAEYTYYHPQAAAYPDVYGEGDTSLLWFRNGSLMPYYINKSGVPASATHPGDAWQFIVYPETISGIQGEPAESPRVTVVLNPTIDQVTPAMGHVYGGTSISIVGSDLDAPLRVRIGGIPAVRFTPVSNTEITAIVPAHPVGDADVVVETPRGTAVLPNGFSYVNDTGLVVRADVNRDGFVDAVDIQLVINVLLVDSLKTQINADVNDDGRADAADVQTVVNVALRRY